MPPMLHSATSKRSELQADRSKEDFLLCVSQQVSDMPIALLKRDPVLVK